MFAKSLAASKTRRVLPKLEPESVARPRGIGDAERAVLLRVALERRSMPSDKALAMRFRVSVRTVQRELRSFWRSRARTELWRVCDDSIASGGGMIAADVKSNTIAEDSIPARPVGTPGRQAEERAQPLAGQVPRSARG